MSTSCIILLSVYPKRRNISHYPAVFLYFSVRLLLPIYCTCRMLMLHLITLSDTQTHTFGRAPMEEGSAGRRHFYLATRNIPKTETSICPWRNLRRQSQQTRGRKQRSQRDRSVSFICQAVYCGWFIEILIALVFPRSFPFYTFFQFQFVYE